MSTGTTGTTGSRPPRARRLRRLALLVVWVLLLAEGGSRAYWRLGHEVPLAGSTPTDWYGVFFEGFRTSRVVEDPPVAGDERLDVLLLGGSVLYNLYEARGADLARRLEEASGRPVRLYDFAQRGHTTRDSRIKSDLLAGVPFDVVVVYHGINDARMNNAPAEMYRDDYTHAAWYAKLGSVAEDEPWDARLLLPFTAEYVFINTIDSKKLRFYVPRNRPNPAWTRHGDVVRTVDAFRDNLAAILEAARDRGQTAVLATFAWFQPDDYDKTRFEAGELGYEQPLHATELWGEPANVAKALVAHNAVIREVARAEPCVFADVEAAIPKEARAFRDVCHLTAASQDLWMDAIVSALSGAPSPVEASFDR